MMRLNEIQNIFKDSLLDDSILEDNQKFVDNFNVGDIPVDQRFGVYQNNLLQSLTGIILKTFPITEKLVGEEFLRGMATQFIKSNLPDKGNMNLYGAKFPAFVEAFELAKALPYLADVTRMEWAWHETYYAPDVKQITAESLAQIPPEKLDHTVLGLAEHAHLVKSKYPIYTIREFVLNDNQDGKLSIDTGGEALMTYRPKLYNEMVLLNASEFNFLSLMKKSQTLGRIYETISEVDTNFDLTAMLEKLFRWNIITDISIENT